MAVRDTILQIIKQRYPSHKMRIEQLYEQDEEFKSLCDDYISCLNFVKKIRERSEESKKTIEDYESIIRDLEKEIFELIYH